MATQPRPFLHMDHTTPATSLRTPRKVHPPPCFLHNAPRRPRPPRRRSPTTSPSPPPPLTLHTPQTYLNVILNPRVRVPKLLRHNPIGAAAEEAGQLRSAPQVVLGPPAPLAAHLAETLGVGLQLRRQLWPPVHVHPERRRELRRRHRPEDGAQVLEHRVHDGAQGGVVGHAVGGGARGRHGS